MANQKNVKSSKKVAVSKVGKAAVAARKSVTAEEFKVLANTVEARMSAVLTAETGIPVKGTNLVQALGQGKLAFEVKGERQVTGSDQLKGNFTAFAKAPAETTAAVFGTDYPVDSMFTHQGLARGLAMAEKKLCNDPADQKMVDAIAAAIIARYPAECKVEAAAKTRKSKGEKAISNPNPLFD
jgi:hypothetical protein